MKERDLQAMSLKYLALCKGVEVLRIPDEVYLVLRLAAEGKPIGKFLGIRARSALAGWPDELVIKGDSKCPYAYLMIRENKVKGGRLTPAQKVLYARLDEKRIPYQIPASLDANLEQSRKFVDYEGHHSLEHGGI